MKPHVACGEGVLEKYLRRGSCVLATDAARHEDETKLEATLIMVCRLRRNDVKVQLRGRNAIGCR